MDKKLENSQEEKNENIQISFEKKKDYLKPTLIEIGAMKRLTLNGSVANPDSGTTFTGENV